MWLAEAFQRPAIRPGHEFTIHLEEQRMGFCGDFRRCGGNRLPDTSHNLGSRLGLSLVDYKKTDLNPIGSKQNTRVELFHFASETSVLERSFVQADIGEAHIQMIELGNQCRGELAGGVDERCERRRERR